jgi:hypothetical protein
MQYRGSSFAYVKFDIEIKRDTIEIERGGKWSSINLPGKAKFDGKLKYGLVDPDLFIDAFDDGDNTTSASLTAIHASIAGTGSAQRITSAITNPTTPQTLQIVTATSNSLTAGYILVEGTDANDDVISEIIEYTATAGTFYGHQVFKTVTAINVPASMDSSDTVVLSAVGQRTITLGRPAYVTIMGRVNKADGSGYVQITCTNCWLDNLPLSLSNASEALLPEQSFKVRDPDSDAVIVTTS